MQYYEKTGYLNTTHKLFYIKDLPKQDIPLHYHDFHKILLFFSGNVSYFIEGRTYKLQPGDIVLVPSGTIHKPVVNTDSRYERIIIYLSNEYFSNELLPLQNCFSTQSTNESSILRTSQRKNPFLPVNALKHSFTEKDSYQSIIQNSLLTQLLVYINRFLAKHQPQADMISTSNETILAILQYINNHLTENLSVDCIAAAFYLNRSYIMHLFKAETGDTLNHYITNKRLFQAQMMMSSGKSLTDICYACGFSSYSAFYRSYKAKYGVSPKSFFQS